MKSGSPKNLPASVRQRLLNLAKSRGEDFTFVLVRYGLERLLYRLGRSTHADTFILKGAMLFPLWSGNPHRATKDMHLLGQGAPQIPRLIAIFRDVVAVPAEDGLVFLPETIQAAAIREDAIYDGIRLTLVAHLDAARLPLRVDVGFGDSVTPAPYETDYPTLLDMPAPHLRVYRRELVVAEKLHAMATLGIANTRMKDFFDLWFLSTRFEFDGAVLAGAVRATFGRRATVVPVVPPIGLTAAFGGDSGKQIQWRAFLNKSRPTDQAPPLPELIEGLRRFLWPMMQAAAGAPSIGTWRPGAGWQE